MITSSMSYEFSWNSIKKFLQLVTEWKSNTFFQLPRKWKAIKVIVSKFILGCEFCWNMLIDPAHPFPPQGVPIALEMSCPSRPPLLVPWFIPTSQCFMIHAWKIIIFLLFQPALFLSYRNSSYEQTARFEFRSSDVKCRRLFRISGKIIQISNVNIDRR
jgi:hypothetical protein